MRYQLSVCFVFVSVFPCRVSPGVGGRRGNTDVEREIHLRVISYVQI